MGQNVLQKLRGFGVDSRVVGKNPVWDHGILEKYENMKR
jgi:hypothetical protein